MPTLTATERDTYATLWGSVPKYHTNSNGESCVPLFVAMSGAKPGDRVLDAGAGAGRGAMALTDAGFLVSMLDLTDEGLLPAAKRLPFFGYSLWADWFIESEYVYCADVMEHIPPEFTMLVLDRMLRSAHKGVFLHISLVPDVFGAWVGKTLHQTVQPFTWWRDRLKELGDVVDARDLMDSAAFFVRPR